MSKAVREGSSLSAINWAINLIVCTMKLSLAAQLLRKWTPNLHQL